MGAGARQQPVGPRRVPLTPDTDGLWPKDRRDLEVCWPMLDATQQAWVRDTIALAHPGHRWLSRL